MEEELHFRRLENMYAAAPINALYQPAIRVSEGCAEIEIEVSDKFFHAAGALYGSVYFKMLDDAAYFAANTYETEFFLLTTSFTTYLTRPVSTGKLSVVGKVVNKNNSQFIAEAVLYDLNDVEVGRGSGVFVHSKMKLMDAIGYND